MDPRPQPDDLLTLIARGEPLGDAAADAACGALLATGLTRRAIVTVLRELAGAAALPRPA